MKVSAVIGAQRTFEARGIASAVTICAKQKRHRVSPSATPVEFAAGPQAALTNRWQATLASLPPVTPGHRLYAGRAFGLVRDLTGAGSGRLLIISAGLGLVDGASELPIYGLTVSRGVAESISDRVTGGFDPPAWFARMLDGRFSLGWDEAFKPNGGRVLVALTRPYAEMVGPSLAGLPEGLRARLRIFGAGLSPVLPSTLAAYVLPYDERLDAIAPGTKSDFAQRALVHFANHVAVGIADVAADILSVTHALLTLAPPTRPIRAPATDSDLLTLIRARLSPRASASRLLRQLRDEDQIACEQGRFTKLFRQAQLQEQAQ